jgi:hypothetical protein
MKNVLFPLLGLRAASLPRLLARSKRRRIAFSIPSSTLDIDMASICSNCTKDSDLKKLIQAKGTKVRTCGICHTLNALWTGGLNAVGI